MYLHAIAEAAGGPLAGRTSLDRAAAAGSVQPGQVALVVVSSDEPELVRQTSLTRLLRSLGVETAPAFGIEGLGASGLAMAIRLLRGVLATEHLDAALLVTVDSGRALAASCVVTTARAASSFRVVDVRVAGPETDVVPAPPGGALGHLGRLADERALGPGDRVTVHTDAPGSRSVITLEFDDGP